MWDYQRSLHVWLMTDLLLILFSLSKCNLQWRKNNLVGAWKPKTGPKECLRLQSWGLSAPCPALTLLFSCWMEGEPKLFVWKHVSSTQLQLLICHVLTVELSASVFLPRTEKETRKGLRERSKRHFRPNEWAAMSSSRVESSSFQVCYCMGESGQIGLLWGWQWTQFGAT